LDAVLSSYTYTYDNVGNRLSVTENDGSVVTYTYDDIYQLTSEIRTGTNPYSITYQYDAVGNRTQMVKNSITTDYTYNNDNQLITELTNGVTTTYNYDDNGNLVSKTDGVNTTTYAWDWRNMLVSVTEAGGVTAYEYDGAGNRISRTVNGVKTKYINDIGMGLTQVLMETDNAGTVQAAYNYGNDLISAQIGEIRGYYHYDGLGSVRLMTDDLCLVTNSYTYDAFGNSVSSASSVANSYGFTGEQQFAEADNLVFLRARYYQPSIGRFMSQDPIGYRGGLNLYTYVMNNPIGFKDPSGLLGYSPWPGHPPIDFLPPEPRPTPIPSPWPGSYITYPAPGTPTPGSPCCKRSETNYKLAGYDNWTACFNDIFIGDSAVDDWGIGIGGIGIGIIRPIGGGIIGGGVAGSGAMAAVFCGSSTCLEYGTTDLCGNCK
jgi:RHS repeat-associated protein